MGRSRTMITAVLGGAVLTLTLAGPAVADGADGERLVSSVVDLEVDGDGRVRVEELLTYAVGGEDRRGLIRRIPVTSPVPAGVEVPDGAPDDWLRVVDVSDVEVTSPTAPDDLEISPPDGTGAGAMLSLRIGDPDRTITGTHEYRIAYVLDGAVTPGDDGPTLLYDAHGTDWEIPTDRVTVRLSAPGELTSPRCAAGSGDGTVDCEVRRDGGAVVVEAAGLAAGEGVTIGVELGPEVSAPPVRFAERRDAADVLVDTPAAGIASGAVALAGTVALVVGLRRRRDPAAAEEASAPAAAATASAATGSAATGDADPQQWAAATGPRAPDGLPPALLAAVWAARVPSRALTATLMDLADRGHLRIEPLHHDPDGPDAPRDGGLADEWGIGAGDEDGEDHDWRLVRTPERPLDDEPRGFERTVLDGVFADGVTEVDLDDHGPFGALTGELSDAVRAEVAALGWFDDGMGRRRRRWQLAGAGLCGMGVLLFFLLAAVVGAGLVGLVVLALGVATIVAGWWAERRTPEGARVAAATSRWRTAISDGSAGTGPGVLAHAIALDVADEWRDAVLPALEQQAADWDHIGSPYSIHGVPLLATGHWHGLDAAVRGGATSSTGSGSAGAGVSVGCGVGGVGGGGW